MSDTTPTPNDANRPESKTLNRGTIDQISVRMSESGQYITIIDGHHVAMIRISDWPAIRAHCDKLAAWAEGQKSGNKEQS